jgi:Flp pilus assembly protein TadD
MKERARSFPYLIWSSFKQIQGIGITALIVAILLWCFAPTGSISLAVAIPAFVFFVYLGLTLGNAAYEAFSTGRRSLPRVLQIHQVAGVGDTESLLLVLEPSEFFQHGIQVSVYLKEKPLERLIGLGSVVEIQDDGNILVALTRPIEGNDILEEIASQKNFDLACLKVNPFVPHIGLAPIQYVIDLEADLEGRLELESRTDKSQRAIGTSAAVQQLEATEGKPEATEKTPEEQNHLLETVIAVRTRNFGRADEVFAEWQRAEADPMLRLKNEIFFRYLRYCAGDTNALGDLTELSKHAEVAAESHYYLAKCFSESGEFEKAAMEYQLAADAYEGEERAKAIAAVGEALFEAGQRDVAIAKLQSEIEVQSNDTILCKLYEGIASLYMKAGLEELRLVALEKAIERKPNDASLHFGSGLSSSNKGLHRLALLHYKYQLRFLPRDKAGLNNIAIEYSQLGMPFLAIACYRNSFELGETLAAANLAYRYLQVGFAEEASQVLDKARQYPDVHPNVSSAIAALSQRRDSESKKEGEILEAAHVDQRFLLTFGDAYFTRVAEISDLGGAWIGTNGIEFQIKHIDKEIEVTWTQTFNYKLTGTISNRAAKVDALRFEYPSKTFELNGFGYLHLSSETEQIQIMTVTKVYGEYQSDVLTLSRAPAVTSN